MKRKGNIDSPDRRVQYTKMVIRQGFLSLIQELPLEKITVTAICDCASINRGTFYAYYKDPSDLFDQIKEELFSKLKEPLLSVPNTTSLYDVLLQILKLVQANKDLCSIILSNTSSKDFLNQIIGFVRQRFFDTWEAKVPSLSTSTLDYLFIFSANGSTGIMKKWLEKGNADTPEDVARLIEVLSTNALNCFLNN